MERKSRRKFSVVKTIAFESGEKNSLKFEKDTCHWQSMCYETSLMFNISLMQIFFKSVTLGVMKKFDESALMQILQVTLGTL